ncbi:hypothetical protein Tco_0222002 [Tanacetum coccineum]
MLKVSSLIINVLGTPVIWVVVHTKTFACALRRSRSRIFTLVGNCLPMVTFCSGYSSFINIFSYVSMQLRMSFASPWPLLAEFPSSSIDLFVLPSSRLCGESDLTITNVSVFVIVRGLSPIVTSNGISPNGHDSSPKKPTRGVLDSTRRDMIDGFNFRKKCSYITSHELPLSKYALFTCLPDMYTLITTRSDEPSFGMGGNVISPVPLLLAGLFFNPWSLLLTIRIDVFSNDGFLLYSFLLIEC